MNNTMRLK